MQVVVIDVDVVTYVAKVQSFKKNTIKLGGKFFLHKDGQNVSYIDGNDVHYVNSFFFNFISS